jgi:hypothetical protein
VDEHDGRLALRVRVLDHRLLVLGDLSHGANLAIERSPMNFGNLSSRTSRQRIPNPGGTSRACF